MISSNDSYDTQGFRGALGGCAFFIRGESSNHSIISTQVAADIINWAFQK